jgi:transcriptional regulator with XRE-family HTH domain
VKAPRLKEWREAMGETQATLSESSGLSEFTIIRMEHGESLRPSTAKKLADTLGISVVDLMDSPPVAAGKAEASTSGQASHAVLLKKALVAARLDAAKTQKARNRLQASEGTLPATHVTGFESDKVGLELREAGFGDDQVEEFVWPLVTKVIEQEREISRLSSASGNVADASGAREEAESEAAEDLEGLGDLLGAWARSLYENEEVRRRLTVGHEEFARRLSEGLLQRAREEHSEARDAG